MSCSCGGGSVSACRPEMPARVEERVTRQQKSSSTAYTGEKDYSSFSLEGKYYRWVSFSDFP